MRLQHPHAKQGALNDMHIFGGVVARVDNAANVLAVSEGTWVQAHQLVVDSLNSLFEQYGSLSTTVRSKCDYVTPKIGRARTLVQD